MRVPVLRPAVAVVVLALAMLGVAAATALPGKLGLVLVLWAAAFLAGELLGRARVRAWHRRHGSLRCMRCRGMVAQRDAATLGFCWRCGEPLAVPPGLPAPAGAAAAAHRN